MSTAQPPPHYNDIPSKDVKYPTKSYGATPQDTSANEPLLGAQASSSRGGTSNAWMDQSDDDIPDDFKVGVAVIDCDTEIRMAFIRKVYSILFVQLLLTSLVSLGLYHPKAVEFQQQHPWTIFIPMVGSFVSLLGVYWKRHQHPANLVILGIFTMFEAMLVGTITSYYESKIVLQALFITVGVFTGLTLFTFQTKWDFNFLGPFLFAGLMGIVMTSFVQIFLPFNANMDLFIACFSVLIFSGFVLYDTQQIMKRLSVDEAILGALTLYLDFINLFLSVLRVLNNSENR